MTEHQKNHEHEELAKLANQMCDETITHEQRDQLESLLAEHKELRPKYLDYLRVHAGLIWRYRTGDSEPDTGSPAADGGPSVSSSRRDSKVKNQGIGSTGNLFKLFSRRSSFLAISACLFIAAAIWYQGSPSHGPIESDLAQSSNQAIAAKVDFVATLREASYAVWGNENQAINVGSRIRVGSLRLDRGEAELVFDSGAKLLLAGPAELQIEAAQSVFLKQGTIAAHMPPEAVGFEVRTPMSTLVDQGTEFGVVVEESGATEVHVFRGQVDLHYDASQEQAEDSGKLELVDQQARKINQPGGIGEAIDFSRSRFGGLALKIAEPLKWEISEGGNGHYYQLVIEKQPVTWHEAAKLAMDSHFRGMPGHLVTVTSAEEDRFIVDNFVEEMPTRGIWMGLTDVLREGYFVWVTGEPFEYNNWASWPEQQPDNFHEAPWHGGEDYGMYTRFPDKQPWAWNDLSIDSIHERVSAYLVEYEPQVDSLRHRSVSFDPVQWRVDQGGNGHYYRLVLAHDSTDWQTIKQRAEATELVGTKGHLVAMESAEEREFITQHILKICGISEIMIGLSGSLEQDDFRWVTGQKVQEMPVRTPHLPTNHAYGFFRWTAGKTFPDGWEIHALDMNTPPAKWFGYLVEYPVETPEEDVLEKPLN